MPPWNNKNIRITYGNLSDYVCLFDHRQNQLCHTFPNSVCCDNDIDLVHIKSWRIRSSPTYVKHVSHGFLQVLCKC